MLASKRKIQVVRKHEASEKHVGSTAVRTYPDTPNLGLAIATINGTYPPEDLGTWTYNALVEENWFVLEGTGNFICKVAETNQLEAESAVYIPPELRYRVEDARGLRIVVATVPAWSADQHKFCAD
jgi:mannose-6-phosphate isomerase-like protein (cupin superfamily)